MSEALLPFVTLERTVIDDCRVFKIERVRRRSQRSGEARDYFHIDCPDWVNVVAITREGELVLVRQERHGIGAFTLELPGGMVDPGESPELGALRELREETGFAGERAVSIGSVHPNPALQDNVCHTFLVRDVERLTEAVGQGDEEIEVVTVPVAKARELVRSGAITHALVVAALYHYEMA